MHCRMQKRKIPYVPLQPGSAFKLFQLVKFPLRASSFKQHRKVLPDNACDCVFFFLLDIPIRLSPESILQLLNPFRKQCLPVSFVKRQNVAITGMH